MNKPKIITFQWKIYQGDPALVFFEYKFEYGIPEYNGAPNGFGCKDSTLAICHYSGVVASSPNKVRFLGLYGGPNTLRMEFIDPPQYGSSPLTAYINSQIPQAMATYFGLNSVQIVPGNYAVLSDPSYPNGYLDLVIVP